MNPTIMTARVTDQHLQLVNEPLIASGGVDVIQIRFEFCGLWEGCGKTAVFYRDPEKVYHVPIADGLATVPWEVLADEGYFYFGVFGAASNRRPTEVIKVKVVQGAITEATAEHQEPTPDIYEQLMTAYGVTSSRLDEAIAMRSASGATSVHIDQANLEGTLATNGSVVDFSAIFWGLPLGPGDEYVFHLDAKYAPMKPLAISAEGLSGLQASVYFDDTTDSTCIRVHNGNSTSWVLETQTYSLFGSWPLSWVSVYELSDLRVGYNGTTYPTAGEAVRAQIGGLVDSIKSATGLLIKGNRTGRRFLSLADVSPAPHLVTVKTTVDNAQQYNVKCAVMGKNLLRPEWLDMSSWDTSDVANNTYEITHLAPGDYVFSLDCPGDSIPMDVFSLQISGNDFRTIDTEHVLYGSSTYNEGTPYRREVQFTVNEGDRVRLWLDTMYYSSPAEYNCTDCQIEPGSVATAYEAPVVREEWMADGTHTREIACGSPAMNFVTLPTHGSPDLSLVRFDVQYQRDIGLALDEIARAL